MSLKRIGVLLPIGLAFVIGTAGRAKAAVTSATLSNFVIPSETINTAASPSGTTVQYTLDAPGDIELDIFHLQNISDQPSQENQVAAIQQQQVQAGLRTIFWDGFWLIGGTSGRQDGTFQFIVNATTNGVTSTFVIPQPLFITSVDIHSLTVTPSFDANHFPVPFPFNISYALAKDSIVTVKVKDSSGATVRTLVSSVPQFGETNSTNTLTWNGLNDAGRPVALGVYTITVDARDSSTGDTATTQSKTASVTSLASLSADPKQVFEANTFVYPNPVRNGQATFQSLAVRDNASISIKIYTIAGDLVRSETFPGLATADLVNFTWDAANQAGKKVGRGLYYVVFRESDVEGTIQVVKKIAVIP